MFDEILVCLDGSPAAEAILPLAQEIASVTGSTLILLKVVRNNEELSAEERYMRERAGALGATVRFLISSDPASAITDELEKNSRAIAALTTHGRSSWGEALLGSVALKVIRGAKRPVILYRPRSDTLVAPAKIMTVMVALDGSEFSEKIVPAGVAMAKALGSSIVLLQALTPAEGAAELNLRNRDVLESSYLQTKAAEIRDKYQIEPAWDVLHGEAGDALCRYVNGMQNTMLAMTSHARAGLERALLGSVTATCIRKAKVPMLIYWPNH
ncbi:MAG TPA: universal stress protein [Candidatus Binatia bacterium]|jgi:nucleotide-binding universal stress UspA family protein